ncbi:MAG: bifunctional 2-polyprenyl-6-hydroxyphenol methylase/3-demethylubiquinol 3-O-methyltransferase UbiG, partial [Candidatus Puniceispirillum sp.]
MQSTVDQKEIDTFAALSDKWWDMKGPMRPLHSFTPIRVDYITDAIRRIKGTLPEQTPLQDLRILDIGCGGGLLAEPMARLGGIVTGIDVTSEAIDAARTHAKASGLDISYHCQSAEDLAASGATFDVIYASEVIEHVADRQVFVTAIADMLAEGGVVVLTTINRTLPAIAFAKYALEYIVRIVPAGTHDPNKFVKPAELRAEFAAVGLLLDDTTGFAPRPGG